MFLDILLGSKATWRIIVLIAESPGMRLTRPEIKKITCLGNNAITESLKDLVVHDVVNIKKAGKKTTYGFNLTNNLTTQLISLCDMEKIRLNNLPYHYSLVLREYVRMVLSILEPERIVLFGSVAKRVYREDSDIDVALVFKTALKTKERIDIEEIAHKIKERFGKEIQQHSFTLQEFKTSKEKLIQEIKRDGIDLL